MFHDYKDDYLKQVSDNEYEMYCYGTKVKFSEDHIVFQNGFDKIRLNYKLLDEILNIADRIGTHEKTTVEISTSNNFASTLTARTRDGGAYMTISNEVVKVNDRYVPDMLRKLFYEAHESECRDFIKRNSDKVAEELKKNCKLPDIYVCERKE